MLGLLVVGCGDGYDASKVKNPTDAEFNAAKQRRDEIFAIYDRAQGEWDKMTPEDKKRLLDLSSNNEPMARQGWGALKNMSRQ